MLAEETTANPLPRGHDPRAQVDAPAVRVSTGARTDLKPLTSLRFLAAFLVFVSHTNPVLERDLLGHAGVGFFFVLSGFILTYTYQHAFIGRFDLSKMRSFWVARVARIYPVHLVTLAIAVWLIVSPGLNVWKILVNALLLQSWFPNHYTYYGLNSVSWSISDEAFFYVLFPFVAWLIFRPRLSSTHLLLVAAVLCGTVIAGIAAFAIASDEWLLYIFPPTRFIDFLAGMLLGAAFVRRTMPTRPNARHATLLEVGLLVAIPLAIVWSPHLPPSIRYTAWLIPFWGALVYVFAHQAGAISALLSHRLMIYLGEISFSFYMIHQLVIRTWTSTAGSAFTVAGLAFSIATSIALAIVLYELVENPMRRRIRAALSR